MRYGQSDPKACLAKEWRYFDRLKSKLRNRDAFNDLLRCLSMFSADLITKGELEGLVGGILVNHQDLLQGFFDFVDTVSMIDFTYEFGKDPKRDESLSPKERTLLETASRRAKYMMTSISELDLSSQERCTTSYRHLPLDYPLLRTSGRQSHHQAVLNDMWVSQLTGSEDYSFKHMRKNQYEDALFRCEVIRRSSACLAVGACWFPRLPSSPYHANLCFVTHGLPHFHGFFRVAPFASSP